MSAGKHIKRPVALSVKEAGRIYRAGLGVMELAESLSPGDQAPPNLLNLLGSEFMDVIEENPGFKFE
jgi:hypothetical protein